MLQRADALIDKFDRPTDPNLFVLPEVKDTRGQSFTAIQPALTLQSGLLASELRLEDSQPINVEISQSSEAKPTLADLTLAQALDQGQTAKAAEHYKEQEEVAESEKSLAEKLNRHLAAAREAERWSVEPATRGQLSFSKQLQRLAAERAFGAGKV